MVHDSMVCGLYFMNIRRDKSIGEHGVARVLQLWNFNVLLSLEHCGDGMSFDQSLITGYSLHSSFPVHWLQVMRRLAGNYTRYSVSVTYVISTFHVTTVFVYLCIAPAT